MQSDNKNTIVNSLITAILMAVVFAGFYWLFIIPSNETISKLENAYRLQKIELEELRARVLDAESQSDASKKVSDSLYADFKKRGAANYTNNQYEKDINFISNSSFQQRVDLLSDWLTEYY